MKEEGRPFRPMRSRLSGLTPSPTPLLLVLTFCCWSFAAAAAATTNTAGERFFCQGGPGEELFDVYGQYGPLCDGLSNCQDGSDERYCETEGGGGGGQQGKARFTGCWSHLSSSPGLFRLSPCSSCLCRADVGDCSRADYLGYDCGRCLTDVGAVGDGVKDCVHGVDEAQDAIALKESLFPGWKEILSRGTWRCPDPQQNEVPKKCGAVLSNLRRPFLYSFAFPEPASSAQSGAAGACPKVVLRGGETLKFWWCAIGECVRDVNHCQGQCPHGFEFNKYTGNCKKLQCLNHERPCDNSCISESRSCHGLCPSGRYFCHQDGQCRDPREPCGDNRGCAPGRHYCPRSNICQPDFQTCGYRTCLATRRRFCYSTGSCIEEDSGDCLEWCPGRERVCKDKCISLTEPCVGECSAGYWPCPALGDLLCLPRFKQCHGRCHEDDETCLDQIGRTVCFLKGTCPFTMEPPTTTIATTTTTTTDGREGRDEKELPSVSPCLEQTCFLPPECAEVPCSAGVCVGLNSTCGGRCLPGRLPCNGTCLLEGEEFQASQCGNGGGEKGDNFPLFGSGLLTAAAAGAAAGGAALLMACCLCLCRMNRRNRRRGIRRKGENGDRLGRRPTADSMAREGGGAKAEVEAAVAAEANRYGGEERRGGGGPTKDMSTFGDGREGGGFEMIAEINPYYGED